MDFCCGVWLGGGHGKNDGITTISITNAGAKSPTFEKWQKKVHLGKMDFFCHLDLVSMIFTDSYRGACHLGKINFFLPSCQNGFRCQNGSNICYINIR